VSDQANDGRIRPLLAPEPKVIRNGGEAYACLPNGRQVRLTDGDENLMIVMWRALSDEERRRLMGLCCAGCGTLMLPCHCMNDE
jgi:hypothetical protein